VDSSCLSVHLFDLTEGLFPLDRLLELSRDPNEHQLRQIDFVLARSAARVTAAARVRENFVWQCARQKKGEVVGSLNV